MNTTFSPEAFNNYKAPSLGQSLTSLNKTSHANNAGLNMDRSSSSLPVKKNSDPAATISISNRMRGQVMQLKYGLDDKQTQLTNLQIREQELNDYGEKLSEIRERAQNFAQDQSLANNIKQEGRGLEVMNLMSKIKEGLGKVNPSQDEEDDKQANVNLREDNVNINQNNTKEVIEDVSDRNINQSFTDKSESYINKIKEDQDEFNQIKPVDEKSENIDMAKLILEASKKHIITNPNQVQLVHGSMMASEVSYLLR